MVNWRFALLLLPLFAGCEWLDSLTTAKVDNPVVGPPPPRLTMTNAEDPAAFASLDPQQPREYGEPQAPISQVANSQEAAPKGTTVDGTMVVAKVNGEPIFAEEILERYARQIAQAKSQLPPAQFEQVRNEVIRRDLPAHIERKVLVTSLKSTLKKEQIQQLEGFLNQAFEQEVERLQQETKTHSKLELEKKLAEQGTSLDNLRNAFINQRMAMEFLGAKTQKLPEISRIDMLRYYEEHAKDYETEAQSKWQEIRISYAKHGGKDKAMAVLEQAISELKQNVEFAEVARRYSDGPTAARGGEWDWTRKGSLADAKIEAALFELPVGVISEVYAAKDGFHLVQVTSRREARRTPFDKLQADIKAKLEQEARVAATNQVLEEMHAQAVVETMFDDIASRPKRTTSLQ